MPYTKNYDLDTDTTLGGDNASDYVAASQKATKTYIDNHSGGGGANTDLSNLTPMGEAHFQKPLVSGTNIKTINSNSLLGNGNIYITPGHTWGTTRPTSTTSTVSSTNPAVVIQNYVNGTSWYRIWSDKWCEQGGVISNATTTLLLDYGNTDYRIFLGYVAGTDGCWFTDSKNTSSFRQRMKRYGANTANSATANYWYAIGYRT